MKEVWDDALDKQLLCTCLTCQSSQHSWEWSKRAVISCQCECVDPEILKAGVAKWPSSVDCIMGVVGLSLHGWHACLFTRKWACYTYGQLSRVETAAEIVTLNLTLTSVPQRCFIDRSYHLHSPTASLQRTNLYSEFETHQTAGYGSTKDYD